MSRLNELVLTLFCLGCHTKCHRMGSLKNRNLFSHSSGDWKPKIKVAAGSVSGDNSPLGLLTAAFLLCTHTAFPLCMCLEGERVSLVKLSGVSFYKGTNSIGSGPHTVVSFNLNYFLRHPPPSIGTWSRGWGLC